MTSHGAERRRSILACAVIAIVLIAGTVAAAREHRPSEPEPWPAPAAQQDQARSTGPANEPRPFAVTSRAGRSAAPVARLATVHGAAQVRSVLALPGCDVTLQLAARQPRRIVECPQVVPHDLGRMLAVAPRQALRFEVPGWGVHASDGAITAPEPSGMWTIQIPACLSRNGEWLCATWYATVLVRS